MNIKILGMGCPSCHALENSVRQALREMQIVAEIENITNLPDILSYDVLSTPALVIDEQIRVAGKIPTVEELKTMLKEIQ